MNYTKKELAQLTHNWLNPLMLKARIASKTGNIESNKCPAIADKLPVLQINYRNNRMIKKSRL
ncbi:MAG TPA: hypothetical protein DFH96_00875 [Bacteroidetes bacterium]|jgi:hypothetical protein|nr:hypothetical protein [Bacteroidota bacterium]